MLIKAAVIFAMLWHTPTRKTEIESSNVSSSIIKKHSLQYQYTITPLVIVDNSPIVSKKMIKLPTSWIITKKGDAAF